jgi:hypothetical protein
LLQDDRLDRLVAGRIKETAEERVRVYVESEEFRMMVENLKRRERERVWAEIEKEIAEEKERLLSKARADLHKEVLSTLPAMSSLVAAGLKCAPDGRTDAERADEILLQNKLKAEDQQRRLFEAKQREDALRLEQVLQRRQLEVRRAHY